ncbi:MAG: class I SAM-dependent methyltransferase [Candidatus Hydrogenedentales bacterium]|jgi:2-polyprenyl-3-methyl-5-hydroxy-6-metoxy-1,4-benzoquinol methylase
MRDFNIEAATWDANPRQVRLSSEVADAILDTVKVTSDTDVMDFGCGTGLIAVNLQSRVRSVTCVDNAPGMLEVLEAKIRNHGIENVKTLCADVSAGGRLEGRYDLIVSSMALHHIEDVDGLLVQFAGVLSEGGHICIADLDLEGGRFHTDSSGVYHNGFDRAALGSAFERAGFEDVCVRTAATVEKPDADGTLREYAVFLISARKKI